MQKVYKTKQSIFLLTNDTGFVLYLLVVHQYLA